MGRQPRFEGTAAGIEQRATQLGRREKRKNRRGRSGSAPAWKTNDKYRRRFSGNDENKGGTTSPPTKLPIGRRLVDGKLMAVTTR